MDQAVAARVGTNADKKQWQSWVRSLQQPSRRPDQKGASEATMALLRKMLG